MSGISLALLITAALLIAVKALSLCFWSIRMAKPELPLFDTLIYSDEKGAARRDGVIYSKLLVSERHGIRGKPDFIYKHRGRPMPVELKSGEIGGDTPHFGDLMQLAAYFIIIEEHFGERPRFGRLIYKDAMFVVRNTGKLRREVLSLVSDMRRMLKDGEAEPSCDFAKCRHCMCRGTVCEFCE